MNRQFIPRIRGEFVYFRLFHAQISSKIGPKYHMGLLFHFDRPAQAIRAVSKASGISRFTLIHAQRGDFGGQSHLNHKNSFQKGTWEMIHERLE